MSFKKAWYCLPLGQTGNYSKLAFKVPAQGLRRPM